MLGLYLLLGRLNFFLAWLLTWIVALVLPILGSIELHRFAGTDPQAAFGLAVTFQVGLGVLMWLLLLRKLVFYSKIVACLENLQQQAIFDGAFFQTSKCSDKF